MPNRELLRRDPHAFIARVEKSHVELLESRIRVLEQENRELKVRVEQLEATNANFRSFLLRQDDGK